MKAKPLVSSLHILSAIILLTDASIHFFVHPLSVSTSTISLILTTFGIPLLIQELTTLASGTTRCKLRMLSSYLSRGIFFLLTAAIVFDSLMSVPCDVQLVSSAYQSSPAKFSLSPPGAKSGNTTANSQHSILGKRGHHKGPPVFGTAFYLAGALAPRCVKVENIPGVPEGSVAWVNVEANRSSRCLVMMACTCTLIVSVVYFVLAMLHRSGKVKETPSMEGARLPGEPSSVKHLEHGPGVADANVDSYAGDYVVDVYSDNRVTRARPADLYQEQNPVHRLHRSVSPQTITTTTRPSTRRQRSTSTTHLPNSEIVIDPRQGAASSPDQIFRIDRIDNSPITTPAHSDTLLHLTPVPGLASQRRERYGYGQTYNQTVDFSSGCIMHYPLFSKKKREPLDPEVGASVYPTLAPPDFSRTSLGIPAGLSPKKVGKGRLSVSSKPANNDQKTLQEEQHTTTAPEPTNSTQLAQPTAVLSPTGIDFPATLINPPPTPSKPHLTPAPNTTTQQRLNTAESNRSILSTSSRPNTSQSAKSANSFRLTRRRRGLFAALDLHPGGGGRRLSAVSGGSHCSVGTFGDGVPGSPPFPPPSREKECRGG